MPKNQSNKADKILVVGPAWVGDMVMAQTLFILLKRIRRCQIDVIAPSWSKPLLERMPEVNDSFDLPIAHGKLALRQRYKIAKQLRQNHYDQAILCPNSLKSALIPFWSKIRKRTGWLGEYRFGLLNDFRILNKDQYPLMVERFMALALKKPEKLENYNSHNIRPCFAIQEKTREMAVKKFQLNPTEKPVLALCPGAEFGPAKRWPEYHYAEVANRKLADGWQVWLFGSKNDKSVSESINATTSHKCVDLTGNTNLGEAIDLLSYADTVVSNDSGLMHIAAALNRKLIVVYGSSSPKFTPPLNDQKRILQLDLECSPCFERTCKFKHLNCLKQLMPTAVLAAMDNFNENSSSLLSSS